MRTWLPPLLLLLACGGADPDNDGLSNAEERELGTGIAVADSDRDGLDDGDEVYEHGTDPLDPDTDRDGFEDGEEVDAGADPTDPLAYPDDRWPDLSARVPDDGPRGWAEGDHAPSWRGTDQLGDRLALDQLYGHVVVLQLTAGAFCTACTSDADAARALQTTYGDDGLFVVQVLVDDDTRDGEVDGAFAATFAERHGLEHPVLVSPEAASSLFDAGVYDGTIPLTILLDRSHRVQGTWAGGDGLDGAAERLDSLLAAPVPGG